MEQEFHWYLLSIEWPIHGGRMGMSEVYMPCTKKRVTKKRIEAAIDGKGLTLENTHITSVCYLGCMTRTEFLEGEGE